MHHVYDLYVDVQVSYGIDATTHCHHIQLNPLSLFKHLHGVEGSYEVLKVHKSIVWEIKAL